MMGANTDSLARAPGLPKVLPSVLSAEDSDEVVEIAEREGWDLALDSVDHQPAWERNFAKNRIGERVVIRMCNAISRTFPNVSLRGYKLYVRKFSRESRASLPVHVDKSRLSVSLALNEGYEGGDLFYTDAEGNDQIVSLRKGDAFLFDGDLMHGVRPVRKGVRYSLVVIFD